MRRCKMRLLTALVLGIDNLDECGLMTAFYIFFTLQIFYTTEGDNHDLAFKGAFTVFGLENFFPFIMLDTFKPKNFQVHFLTSIKNGWI